MVGSWEDAVDTMVQIPMGCDAPVTTQALPRSKLMRGFRGFLHNLHVQ